MARAIKKLRVLGSGFAVIPVGGRRLVQSVPGELSMDHTAVLQVAEVRKGREREREMTGLFFVFGRTHSQMICQPPFYPALRSSVPFRCRFC